VIRVYDAAANLIRNARGRGTIRRFMNVIREDSNSGRFVRRQPICQAAFNGELGNSRDASVDADDTKSKLLK
jgi:hypothetical protein